MALGRARKVPTSPPHGRVEHLHKKKRTLENDPRRLRSRLPSRLRASRAKGCGTLKDPTPKNEGWGTRKTGGGLKTAATRAHAQPGVAVPREQDAVHAPRRMDPHVKTTLRSSGQAAWGTRKTRRDPSLTLHRRTKKKQIPRPTPTGANAAPAGGPGSFARMKTCGRTSSGWQHYFCTRGKIRGKVTHGGAQPGVAVPREQKKRAGVEIDS